ncbi:MAG: hypothetical protein JWO38_759 [Gemmataceae bacterium]|nr:hypothetical protein [Gemmataceae bacterium]
MHPDASAFERTILVAPADRTPQLVYADWLDEHEDPEFAAIVRSDDFADIAATAAGAELTLRQAWDAAKGVRRLTGSVGAIGLAVVTFAPMLRLVGESLRAAAIGVVLSASSGRPAPTSATAEPQVRRVS